MYTTILQTKSQREITNALKYILKGYGTKSATISSDNRLEIKNQDAVKLLTQ